ncbi:MAG: tail fiber domain-containing protein [Phycisphaerales bacterium]|nr:MAG: tail fiber domain-containing protein [Phycisphaerales bacterium]
MKTRTLVTIMAVLLTLCLGLSGAVAAWPIGTAFTYQGRLVDSNEPADGLYDFEFELYDEASDGNQVGSTIDVNGLDVIEGFFAAELDFGDGDPNVFPGDARWLEIRVRPGGSAGAFTTLSPRQEITPVPYSLLSRGIFVDAAGNVGIGETDPEARLEIYSDSGGDGIAVESSITTPGGCVASFSSESEAPDGTLLSVNSGPQWDTRFRIAADGTACFSGNVGIGTWAPRRQLEILTPPNSGFLVGNLSTDFIDVDTGSNQLTLNAPGGGDIMLQPNSTGKVGIGPIGGTSLPASLTVGDSAGVDPFIIGPWGVSKLVVKSSGNVGIGTPNPTEKLEVNLGMVKAAGFIGTGLAAAPANTVHGKASGDANAVYGEHSNERWGYLGGDYGAYGSGPTGSCGYLGGYNVGVYGEGWARADGAGYGVSGRSYRLINPPGNDPNTLLGTGVYAYGGAFDFFADGPGVNYGATSSVRWKRNIRPINDSLGKIEGLRGVRFDWDAEHGGQSDIGMVAEEVGRVLPEIVRYEENGIDATGMDYSKLTPLLVEAVKELKAENDSLKRRLEALESRISQNRPAMLTEVQNDVR